MRCPRPSIFLLRGSGLRLQVPSARYGMPGDGETSKWGVANGSQKSGVGFSEGEVSGAISRSTSLTPDARQLRPTGQEGCECEEGPAATLFFSSSSSLRT